jgi:hypothetical protein
MTHLEQRARFSVLREFHIPSILGLKILGWDCASSKEDQLLVLESLRK